MSSFASILRHGFSLAVAAGLTWWFLFHAPAPAALKPEPAVPAPSLQLAQAMPPMSPPAPPPGPPPAAAPMEAPPVESAPDEPEPEPEPVEETPVETPEEVQALPEEAGSREGTESGELQSKQNLSPEGPEDETSQPVEAEPASEAEPEAESESESTSAEGSQPEPKPVDSLKELTEDRELLEAARQELDGEVKQGFSTRFIGSARDQLAIARAFGEQVVLIPKSALDDQDPNAFSYVLDLGKAGRVKKVPGRPDLSKFRQYRDLFAFKFPALPEPMRRLRTSVVIRDDIFLFAALIPANEWAVAVGRRRQALKLLGRTEEEVERFTLRYVRATGGRFDFSVDAIDFADGSTWRSNDLPRR